MEEKQRELRGLTSQEVQERKEKGLINTASTVKTKSVKRIFYDNICTVFNIINVILFIALLCVGSYKNLLFMLVIAANTIIGIVQELRSKKSVDTLTILTESKLDVLRDGKTVQLYKEELVLDDIIVLTRGNQVPADCILIRGSCKANESLLTGESNLIEKQVGDEAALFPPAPATAASTASARTAMPPKSTTKPNTSKRIIHRSSNPSNLLSAFAPLLFSLSVRRFFPAAILFTTAVFRQAW